MKTTYRIGTYIIWSVNLPLLKEEITSETLELPDFLWEPAWEGDLAHTALPPAAQKTGFVAPLASSSLLKLVQKRHGLRTHTEKKKWLLSSPFSRASDAGTKNRAVLNLKQKNIRKTEAIYFHFVLIFYTLSAGLCFRVFARQSLAVKWLQYCCEEHSGPRGGNRHLGLWNAVKAADFIMTYTAYIILCHHVSPLQMNFYFHVVITDIFLKTFLC